MTNLLNVHEVAERLGISRSMVEKLRRSDADFPPPVRLGVSVRWRPDDLDRYVAARVGA